MAEFNITKHNLFPQHTKLSEEEKVELLKRHNISLRQLPKILDNDPIVKLINAKHDDVIKIARKSKTMGEAIFYRVVIHG